jgi:hypothetical protein
VKKIGKQKMKETVTFLLLFFLIQSANGQFWSGSTVSTTTADPNFSDINVRLNGTAIPTINFSRFTGLSGLIHNAAIGQFFNSNLGEYSFQIATGHSNTGDQTANHNVLTATLGGRVGIHTTEPRAIFDVGLPLGNGVLSVVLGRLEEGNADGDGTYLGVRGYSTQPVNVKSFGLEHGFYGVINSSVNFNRGGRITGGFITLNTNDNTEKMRIDASGNVGIGTANPQHRLHVNGAVYSTEVRVDVAAGSGPDYVFLDNYPLPSLEDVKNYINTHKHLPGVPSAKEMEANGIQLGEMNLLLLKKIEELTLYQMQLLDMIETMNKKISNLEKAKTGKE